MPAASVKITVLEGDLPEGLVTGPWLNVDTERMGLDMTRDRVCLVQIHDVRNKAFYVIKVKRGASLPRLTSLLSSTRVWKTFHYAYSDIGALYKLLGTPVRSVLCTRTLSKIGRTYQQSHGLDALLAEYLGLIKLKHQGCTYWGGALNDDQVAYALKDVAHLHKLYLCLMRQVKLEGREKIFFRAMAAVEALAPSEIDGFNPTYLMGWAA